MPQTWENVNPIISMWNEHFKIHRQYCILMPKGEVASLRRLSKLTMIKPSVQNGTICLNAPDLPTLQLPNSLDELKGETHVVE